MMKLLSRIILFLLGCLLLSYGSAMLFFVPGSTLGHYFDANRILYGIAPVILSVLLFATIGVLSARWSGSQKIALSIANTVSYGISVVVLFYLAMSIVSIFRQG